jgi:hypothetical protein
MKLKPYKEIFGVKTIFNFFPVIIIIFLSMVLISHNLHSQEETEISLTDGIENEGLFIGYTFADSIIEHSGKEIKGYTKNKALNGVYGLGDTMGSLDVFIVGDDQFSVFEWKGKRIINGKGDDLKVFENGFFMAGSTERMSLDLATVEVSKNGETWHPLPVTYDDSKYKNSPSGKEGFVGLKPVYLNMDNNFIYPSEDGAGGDAFDLSDAGIEEGDFIRYIKIIDGGKDYPDGQVGSNGVDIDGVCAFYWVEEKE